MTDEEFRDKIGKVIRRHDPEPDELRDLAESLETLADQWEAVEDLI